MRAQSDVYGARLAKERSEHLSAGSQTGDLAGIEIDAYVLVDPVAAYISGFKRENFPEALAEKRSSRTARNPSADLAGCR